MKTIKICSILVFVTLVTLYSTAFSAQKEYTFGVEDVFYLPYYAVEKGQYIGLLREILDAFAQKKGYRFVYRPLPIKRLHRTYLNSEVDFLYPDNPDWIRTQKKGIQIVYSDSVVTVIDGVMVLPENKGRGIAGLKKLGTIRGYTALAYEDFIQTKQLILHENNTFKGLLKMATANRIDGAYVTINPALHQLREILHQPNALVFDEALPYDYAEHQLSTIKHPEMITLFNEFLETEKGLLEMLKKKYKIQK